MILKPPPVEKGTVGLAAFRAQAEVCQSSLTNRMSRKFYRDDLAKWQRLYATLASKRAPGSDAAVHFAAFSSMCGELLVQYGPEPPPKMRTPKAVTPAPLSYPDFPDDITHRIHFLEGQGARRQRAIQIASHADFISRQMSGSGRVLVSVGTRREVVRLFERLVEALGDGLFGDPTKAGFNVGGVLMSLSDNPKTDIERIWWDNNRARGYSWQARALGDQYLGVDGKGLPDDLPIVKDAPAWDPDPRWQRILDLTEANRLAEAMVLVEAIPGPDRESLLDEVVYLRFLTGTAVKADDIRFIARKYAERSLISGRLLDDFETYLGYLDREVADDPPIISSLIRLSPEFGKQMIPPMPPASDWPAYRAHHAQFINSSAPRGRIFSLNIDVGFNNVMDLFAGHMTLAEDAFRRDRSIPEIGRGWVSEVALLDLFRSVWPSAVHQWRPWFLGRQSIDIYVPEINLAVEYQGLQHFEAIALFGGEESFKNGQIRDQRKRDLLASNTVRLLEWRYDARVTSETLHLRLAEMGIEMPKGD